MTPSVASPNRPSGLFSCSRGYDRVPRETASRSEGLVCLRQSPARRLRGGGARMSEHDFDVVVIGGGQAGLAMGYYLREHGRRFVIFERGDSIAPAWRERWDSLKLFTPRGYSSLPGLPFPGDPDDYPTRDEVIAYLERYAETFELPIELDSEVEKLEQDEDGRFGLELAGGRTVAADQVVVATGPFQEPYVPKVAENLAAN